MSDVFLYNKREAGISGGEENVDRNKIEWTDLGKSFMSNNNLDQEETHSWASFLQFPGSLFLSLYDIGIVIVAPGIIGIFL